jgi:hypothetical protein
MTAQALPDRQRRDARRPEFLGRSIAIVALLILAWCIYLPAQARPFDYVDFPENLKLLRDNDGFANGYRALMRVYADHGRWSPITMLSWAGQWSAFGSWAPGWHFTRFAIMAAIVALALGLYRRIGLSTAGAFAGASLLVVSPAAIPGWIRPSTGEPLAVLWVIIASHIALRRSSPSSSVMLAALMIATMWTKELVATAFVFPLAIALCLAPDGLLQRPRMDPARRRLLGTIAVAFALGSIPIFLTFISAPAGAFTARYSASNVNGIDVVGGMLAAIVPFAPLSTGPGVDLPIVLVVVLLVFILGWIAALKSSATRQPRLLIFGFALLIPLVGGIAYAPWPFYRLVYALPFLLAGSLLFGQAVSAFANAGIWIRVAGLIGVATVLTFSVMQAANDSARTRALHVVFASTVTHVAAMRGVDSVLVEVAANQYDHRGNFGPRFLTYAWMLDLQWPHVRDVPCGPADSGALRRLRIRLNVMCAAPIKSDDQIVARYARFSWPNPWPRRDSVAASIHRGE